MQLIGAALVVIAAAIIRKHELRQPAPWERARAWLGRLLRRPQVVTLGGVMSTASGMEIRAKVRPKPVQPAMTDEQRLQRLEQYVERLDADLDEAHDRISRKADSLTSEAKAREQAIRDEQQQRDEERLAAVRPALRFQSGGGVCIFVGLLLALLGIVAW